MLGSLVTCSTGDQEGLADTEEQRAYSSYRITEHTRRFDLCTFYNANICIGSINGDSEKSYGWKAISVDVLWMLCQWLFIDKCLS
jgi:hypothetical protein